MGKRKLKVNVLVSSIGDKDILESKNNFKFKILIPKEFIYILN